jgi:hypothetical protein
VVRELDVPRTPTVPPAHDVALSPGGAEGVLVYAALAGLLAALPVPVLDELASGLARGAALRRVARRHGVVLGREARDVLRAPSAARAAGAGGRSAGLVRAVLRRAVAPLRALSRVDDALGTVLAALLLDHYLARRPRSAGCLGVAEARRVRAAIDAALASGGLAALRDLPGGALAALRAATDDARGVDPEGRRWVERVTDAVMDALADAPAAAAERLRAAFDRELARAEAEA